MNQLLTNFIGSEILLLMSCFLLYLLMEKTIKSVDLHVLIYTIGGVPLIYMTWDQLSNPSVDANIGLGLAFMYTWLFSGVTVVIFVVKLVLKLRKV